MDLYRIRTELRMGRSIYDLPVRVTFYARVSTDQDEQINSLENQVQYYTELIQSKQNWEFVPGYVDEGISGTGTKRRDSFNRMIQDAKNGLFDFIITKEISRFSRSTLDSIRYTQELLNYNVGVFFQNDNINTLDTDSEFRLVIMAGVAQDEVRKLSERLKFGFRQAIRNGHVLGNDRLYGYDKKGCILTVKDKEAEMIRTIFDLYANHGLGIRMISQKLREMGYTSREGNNFNTLTIRHIIENPKYKGWYCGNKSHTLDYRTGKKAYLNENEWVMYPDPAIPAIVSEELWDRANALYKARRRDAMEHSSGATFHHRYPYSAKIICELHQTTYHRQVLKSTKGTKEVWQCKRYRQEGRIGCTVPQVRSIELDYLLGVIFKCLLNDRETIIDILINLLSDKSKDKTVEKECKKWQEEITGVERKKEHLLELSMAGALTAEEFKRRNDEYNERIVLLKLRMKERQENKESIVVLDQGEIRRALNRELCMEGKYTAALSSSLLEKIVVKQESTKEIMCLEIFLKTGQIYDATYAPKKVSACSIRLKSIMHKHPIRKI